jgi:hypothetical protein
MENETYSTDAAICPYCGYENRPEDSDGILYDENTGSYECGDCAKAFKVRVCSWFSWMCEPNSLLDRSRLPNTERKT